MKDPLFEMVEEFVRRRGRGWVYSAINNHDELVGALLELYNRIGQSRIDWDNLAENGKLAIAKRSAYLILKKYVRAEVK